ncbi:MAG: methyltransferase domain-containing protein, partial [Candidatus Eisenbacteria bacterium]
PRNHAAERCTELMRTALQGRKQRPLVLVVGGGTVGQSAEPLYADPVIDVLGFDVYASAHTSCIADGPQIPLAAGCVDAVLVQAVLEHVLEPARVVAEIHRVLRADGLVYAETPFLQAVHEGPWDFTRFTESGHRWLFRAFERLDSGVVSGPGLVTSWTLDHLVRGWTRSRLLGQVARLASVWLAAFDRFVPEALATDAASCVYFYGRRSEHTLTPHEIIAHYRGAQRP